VSLLIKGAFATGYITTIIVGFSLNAFAQSTPLSEVTPPPDTSDLGEQPLPTPIPPPPDPSLAPSPSETSTEAQPEPPNPSDFRFPVRQIRVTGNTVLETEIADIVNHFLADHDTATFDELISLRSLITQLYIDNGYINSGAFLPNNQDLSDGEVEIQVVEGRLEDIQITGLTRLQEVYIRSRLNLANSTPLNQQDLEEALQLLQLNPLIQQVNAELTAGSAPGQNILLVEVKEASPFQLGVGGDNYQSPSIGAEQFSVQASYDNLLGLGDRISAGYGITEGLDSFDVGFSIPVNPMDGTLSLGYSNDDSLIIETDFEDLDIRSESETFSLGLRQPIVKTPTEEFALGLGIDLRRSTTLLEGEPFSFSVGPEEGESNVTVIRLSQDWVERDTRSVLAARSQFSLGIDAFDATVNDTGTDGRFVAWIGQFQWLQQLSPRFVLVSRLNAQLTPDSLLPLERFGFGGADTVRGYRQNQLVTDNGILGATELRFSLLPDSNRLQIIPFVEAGHGWNNDTPDPDPATLVSLGLGLRWLITPDLSVRVDYGFPLVDVEDEGDSLQDSGLYFSIRYQPF
jgi:hemolysin activation/secretion protein